MRPLPWHPALAAALVGERLDLGTQDRPDVPALIADLATLGWDAPRIAATARDASPWPFPMSDADRAALGVAQFHAALRDARRLLGLEFLTERPRSRRTELNADERRLLGDVPPHY